VRGAGGGEEGFGGRLLKGHSPALAQRAVFRQPCKEWLAGGLKIQLNTCPDPSINIISSKNNMQLKTNI